MFSTLTANHTALLPGADLAHIGAQFGDRYTLDAVTLERSRKKDEMLLGHVRNVDAGWVLQRDQGRGRPPEDLRPDTDIFPVEAS